MTQQLVFLDAEFTGLGQRWPRLISIGLVSEDGAREFYAELTPEGYMEKVTPWVRDNILPLLEAGNRITQPRDLCRRLAGWIADLGPVRLAGDIGILTDIKVVESMLEPWPLNLDRRPEFMQFDTAASERFTLAVEEAFANGLRRHPARRAGTDRSPWLGRLARKVKVYGVPALAWHLVSVRRSAARSRHRCWSGRCYAPGWPLPSHSESELPDRC